MKQSATSKIIALKNLSLKGLRDCYREHFPDKKIISNNRSYLWRRIAYKVQEAEYGELSLKAQNKLQGLMADYDPINNPVLKPQMTPSGFNPKRDRRLPLPGTLLTKDYKNAKIQVKVLEKGFEYDNKIYNSLTSAAKAVTGNHCNGYTFFNL